MSLKLLFDHNLSPRLVKGLSDMYPGSNHVYYCNIHQSCDEEVWEYARNNNYLIVTKDADFSDLCTVRGFPPRILWIRLGNCTTRQIEELLRLHCEAIMKFVGTSDAGVLILYPES